MECRESNSMIGMGDFVDSLSCNTGYEHGILKKEGLDSGNR